MNKYTNQLLTQKGFSLIEVMVAMVIFSIGLLGLAGLQSLGLSTNQTAYLRTTAMQQAYNMADRIRENPAGVESNSYDTLTSTTPSSEKNCIKESCNPGQQAAFDYFEWFTSNAELLPNGRGTVTGTGNQLLICVMWNELNLTGNPGTPDCSGEDDYDPTTQLKFYTLLIDK